MANADIRLLSDQNNKTHLLLEPCDSLYSPSQPASSPSSWPTLRQLVKLSIRISSEEHAAIPMNGASSARRMKEKRAAETLFARLFHLEMFYIVVRSLNYQVSFNAIVEECFRLIMIILKAKSTN